MKGRLLPASIFAAASLLITNVPVFVVATVSYGGSTFESMPSSFGMVWEPPNETHQTHLQFLSANARLCNGLEDGGVEGLVVPTDNLKVALLVERGDCSFELKASVAMQAYPTVSYMIVYDDQVSKNLVSMRETYSANGITLGMLFVAHRSGMALRAVIQNQTEEVIKSGGPIVELNGLDPIMLSEKSLADLQTWILIAMGGFFTFITVFGCLLVFVQLGVIPVNGSGQIILTPEAIRRSRRLLTVAEVARLQVGGDLHGKLAGSSDEEETQQTTQESPSGDLGNAGSEGAANTDASSSDDNIVVTTSSLPVDQVPFDQEEDQSCAVCLDELAESAVGEENSSETTLCLPCNHKFHSSCIIPWLTERQGTCPLCKFDVLQFIVEFDEKTSKRNSSERTSFSWCKQQASRVMRLGWSPVESSDSESQQAEGSRTGEQSDNNSGSDTTSADGVGAAVGTPI